MRFIVVVRRLLVLSAVGVFLGGSSRDAEAITYRTVALSGQQAPGVDDAAEFAGFNRPVINRSGKVAFTARLNEPNREESGIWSEGMGRLALIARQGLAAPGTDVEFTGLLNPFISNGGQTAFMALLSGTGVDNSNRIGIWSNASGSLQMVARDGSPALSAGDGMYFSQLRTDPRDPESSGPVVDDLGRSAFSAVLKGASVDSTIPYPARSETFSKV